MQFTSHDFRPINFIVLRLNDSTHQRLQFFVIHQVELNDKVIEMLVAGVDVGLSPHLAHAVKVVDVDVDKHPEQT